MPMVDDAMTVSISNRSFFIVDYLWKIKLFMEAKVVIKNQNSKD